MRDAENTPRTQFPDGDFRPVRRGEVGEPVVASTCNERPYRRPPDQVEPLRLRTRQVDRGRDDDEPGYVIHLPVRVLDLAAATALANQVADSLGFLPELDAGETTVSTADDQNNRSRVFCDLLLPDRSRCPQRYGHSGPCGETPLVPEPRPVPRPSTGP
ncbi:hypothetical protein [Micromonospora sp. NBRC 101691]|uniref:hypothetical protein n=1 Tax=Micromonospora sp. NBRC 101691 TaxID=3032198 RepID=UPI0024A1FC60|nr:hypothetical protein [Micromonospora sp. NBRC 101691]GLY25421.1 hypothetical protein Misp04_51520 [Micromonospora sp. NBRC 101691]